MSSDPFALFDQWFAEARAAEVNDADAMALATADATGQPSVRMVLLKGHGPDGFVFYTNLGSRKGGELAANPRAALAFQAVGCIKIAASMPTMFSCNCTIAFHQ